MITHDEFIEAMMAIDEGRASELWVCSEGGSMTPAEHKAEAERLLAYGNHADAQVHALLYIGGLLEVQAGSVATCIHGATGVCMSCVQDGIQDGLRARS